MLVFCWLKEQTQLLQEPDKPRNGAKQEGEACAWVEERAVVRL